jgi:hypothetical protein
VTSPLCSEKGDSMNKFFFSLACILLVGCSTNVPYQAKKIQSEDEARKIIKQVIIEQPRQYAPVDIVFFDEYFQIYHNDTRRGLLAGGVATVPIVDTVYLNNVKSVEIYQKSLYIILVRDNTNYPKIRIYTREKAKGEAFVDALTTLVSLNEKRAAKQ